MQPTRPRRRSRARRGPQGQFDPAVARVGCLGTRTTSRVFAFVSAPADTLHASPLAVSMVTRFRSTSSRARSRPRRSTSRTSGSASRPPSSSRAASRRMACSRSSSAPPAPRAFAFVSAPLDTPALSPSRPTHGSLADNQLCGLDPRGRGTYTAEGITKLCEGLKGSAVTSLGCAAAPKRVRIYG